MIFTPTLRSLIVAMQDDMPRVRREAKKKQAHHKLGLNRSHNGDTSWMPQGWIVPTQGTYVGRLQAHLHDEPPEDV
jgi:hypothetical protein